MTLFSLAGPCQELCDRPIGRVHFYIPVPDVLAQPSDSKWKPDVGIDATPAPLREVSIGAAIEKFTGARFGSSGTMTAAAVITKAVQSVPVKRIGYSGLMLPVMEDSLLAQRWSEGTYEIGRASCRERV